MADGEPPITKRPGRQPKAPSTPDAIEIAMEAADDPTLAEPVRALLEAQTRYVNRQMASETAGLALKVLTGLTGVAFAIGLGVMVWQAFNERGLVIQTFSVPPEFETRGVTGKVVASKLLDRLGELQAQTQSTRAPSTYANNWNGDIKVEIPSTGVSISELRRLLVAWLGSQTTIDGEVYSQGDKIVVAARTGTAPAKTHEGAPADLDALMLAAAEDVFRTTQPYRYAIYLGRNGDAEGQAKKRAALQRLSETGDPTDRLWALSGLSNSLNDDNDLNGALEALAKAKAIDPDFPLAYNNLGAHLSDAGRFEEGYQAFRMAGEKAERYGKRYMKPEALAYVVPAWKAGAAMGNGDYATAASLLEQANRATGDDRYRSSIVLAQILLHDIGGVRQNMPLVIAAEDPGPDADPRARATFANGQASAEVSIAFSAEDWPGVLRAAEGFPLPGGNPVSALTWATGVRPFVAVALAKQGRVAEARAMVESTPLDCYQCVISRASVAATAGDARAADGWFARAKGSGPSLPDADSAWAYALLQRGDLAGAETHFKAALKVQPRFIDALLGLGEVQMAQGKPNEAVRQFRDAATLSPNWGRARLRWGQALAVSGHAAEARGQFQTAVGLDLTPTDREEARRRLRS
jgi:tetratricopeptide (TPR) repeat protein